MRRPLLPLSNYVASSPRPSFSPSCVTIHVTNFKQRTTIVFCWQQHYNSAHEKAALLSAAVGRQLGCRYCSRSLAESEWQPSRLTVASFADELANALLGKNITDAEALMME